MHLRVTAAPVLMALVAVLGAGPPAGAAALRAPVGTPTARHFAGTPTVGALFAPGSSVHICTASVVDSRAGDLVLTAAHCISGTGAGDVFAPGYRDGVEPFGTWTVVGAYGAPGWMTQQAPQRDVAFLVVAPRQVNGHPEEIEAVTGANQLGTAPVSGERVTVPAYAVGSDDDPRTCTARVYFHLTYPAFNCNPYVDGTSGAPWLHRTSHGWEVVGIIGGLRQGGCSPWISYSAAFGASTWRTAERAATGVGASIFPAPRGDGCTTGL